MICTSHTVTTPAGDSNMHGVLLLVQRLPLGQIQPLQTVRHTVQVLLFSGFILTLPLIPMATCTLHTLIFPRVGLSTLPALRLAPPIHLGVQCVGV